MTTPLRILCAVTLLSLAAGLAGLRRGNAALETRLSAEARR